MADLANREFFLKRLERRYTTVTLPVSGKTVDIQSLSEAEKSAYEAAIMAKTSDGVQVSIDRMRDARSRLIVLVLVDPEGNRLLMDGDMPTLRDNMDGAESAAIYDTARVHCGFAKGDIEALVKNSSSPPDEG
jgi:hypothetical protein